MGRRTYSGSAAETTLDGAITNGAISLTLADGSTYPSPTISAPMVIVVDPEQSTEEQILISARSGNVLTVATNGRNWHLGGSGTGQGHDNGAVVRHVLDAATVDEVNDHTFTTSRDDHSQYLNTARHAAVAHSGAMLTDLTVATADLADTAVTYAKLAAGQRWEPGDFKWGIQAADHTGWLICDGRAISQATYSGLWSSMGSAHLFGADPGSGNFLLPDLRGRVPMGKAASGTGSTLGGTGGSKDAVTISHGHNHGHTASAGVENSSLSHGHSTSDPGNHTHSPTVGDADDWAIRLESASNGLVSSPIEKVTFTTMAGAGAHTHTVNSNGPSNHNHNVTVNADSTAAGSSGTDANLPPFMALNGFIHA